MSLLLTFNIILSFQKLDCPADVIYGRSGDLIINKLNLA